MKLKERIKGIFTKDNFIMVLNYIKDFTIKHKEILIAIIPFLLMHIYITIMSLNVSYNFKSFYVPLLFSTTWIMLFIGISVKTKNIIGKSFYIMVSSLFALLFFVNGVYYSIMSNFFNFTLLESVSEGMAYSLDALKNCNPLVYIAFFTIPISIFFGIKYFPKRDKNDYQGLLHILILFVILHLITPLLLGRAHTDLTWSSWRNARNIYNAYNDPNKSIKISGFFEFEIRDFYMTFLKPEEQESKEDIDFLNNAMAEVEKSINNYTGLFKDKNLIIVQFEGMDDWIVNAETTPVIYRMMNEGINFTNHFSFYNGGGSTFNSEFAINTGYVTPFSYMKNAYSFNKNNFPYSLAKLFKAQEYTVNAFHMNTGEYYSRRINYKNWGYDSYNSLKELGTYTGTRYELDRELILNEEFNKLEFPETGKFVDYIIAYSGHLPFTNIKGVCKQLYNIDNTIYDDEGNIIEAESTESDESEEIILMSEEECIRRQNLETDYMMELLLENLREKGLLDSTVIVGVTDHYLYTVEDQSILDKYKETSNNLINRTPFFIWSNDLNSAKITKVNSQLDILPTLLNLFGIEYNPNSYVGSDILDPNYNGIVFFSDYSWYDGNAYVDGGEVINGAYISEEDLENKNYRVSVLTRKNDLVLKYNYFK